MDFIVEACVETLSQALDAEDKGAHQIELCSRLDQDGLSPSRVLIVRAHESLMIPIKVMIRPRPGDFEYNEDELGQIALEIEFCKSMGIKHVVFGVSKATGRLDIPGISMLAEIAAPMRVTIHKAIDNSPEILADLLLLQTIPNVHSVLSSGGGATAELGTNMIRQMIAATSNAPMIIAAGKITHDNLTTMHQKIGARAYHGRKILE